jgi:quercetin dioxygenase-like cupin family protein
MKKAFKSNNGISFNYVCGYIISLIVSLPMYALAQQPEQVDPLVVSPDKFSVLLENEHVRVLEYTLLPGQQDEWHTHPPKVSYVVTEGRLRIHLADGSSIESDEKAGSASWMNDLPLHYAENIGTTAVQIVLIEVKSAAVDN